MAGSVAGDLRRRRPRAVRWLRRDDGVAVTELALVLPLLLVLLIGMIDFGKAVNYWIDMTHLANEGSRLAVVNSNPGASQGQTLQYYIAHQADSGELTDGAKVSICWYKAGDGSSTSTPSVGDSVKVTLTYQYNWSKFLGASLPIIGKALAVASTTIGSSSAMRIETVSPSLNYQPSDNTGPAC